MLPAVTEMIHIKYLLLFEYIMSSIDSFVRTYGTQLVILLGEVEGLLCRGPSWQTVTEDES